MFKNTFSYFYNNYVDYKSALLKSFVGTLSSWRRETLRLQRPAGGHGDARLCPSNEFYQNILTVRDAYWSLVWTEIHIQVFMITYMTLDRPCTSIIKTGCLGCQIISNSQPVTQKNVNNLQINYIKIWSPYSTLIVV